jgi:hypothetical protein
MLRVVAGELGGGGGGRSGGRGGVTDRDADLREPPPIKSISATAACEFFEQHRDGEGGGFFEPSPPIDYDDAVMEATLLKKRLRL